jgi:probable blue pigment (indigoidine) exporter
MKRIDAAAAGTALATLAAPVSWGTTYVTVTELLPDGRPLLVAAVRVVPAGVVLLAVTVVRSRWRPHGAEWWRTALMALFNFGLFFPLLAVAVYRLPGGVAAAFGGLQPLLVACLTAVIVRRRPRPVDLALGFVAALGVALVVIRPGAHVDAVGVLAAVGATLSFTMGVVLTKQWPPANRLAATGWQLLMGGVMLVPLMFLVEGAPPAFTTRNLVGVAYLSLVATALAFVVWFKGISKLPVSAPPLFVLAAPVTGVILGWALLDQSLTIVQLAGLALALTAIAYGALVSTAAPVPSPVLVCQCGSRECEAPVRRRRGPGPQRQLDVSAHEVRTEAA